MIVRAGDEGDEMFFITDGAVDIISSTGVTLYATKGTGDLCASAEQVSTPRPLRAVALGLPAVPCFPLASSCSLLPLTSPGLLLPLLPQLWRSYLPAVLSRGLWQRQPTQAAHRNGSRRRSLPAVEPDLERLAASARALSTLERGAHAHRKWAALSDLRDARRPPRHTPDGCDS